MSDCERCQSLLDLYIDHELEESERLFVEKHLEQCPDCQAQWLAAQEMEKLFAQWAAEEIEPPADFRENLFARLETEMAPVVPRALRAQKKKSVLIRLLPWAAAAVLLLALMPAAMHLADGRSNLAENARPQLADNTLADTAEKEAVPQQEAAPEESLSADEQPKINPSVQEKNIALPQQAPDVPEPAKQKNMDSEQSDLTALENDDTTNTNDSQTPMLASGYALDGEQAPAGGGEQQTPPVVMYRSAAIGETDWEALKEQNTHLKQQYSQELEQLKQQYEQAPSDELEQAIADKEAELQVVEDRRKAIENEDAEAYAASGE